MPNQRKGACCSGSPVRVSFINIRGERVGIVGLGEIFERLRRAGWLEDDALRAELLAQARIYNYIVPANEEAYEIGLLRAYQTYVRSRQ